MRLFFSFFFSFGVKKFSKMELCKLVKNSDVFAGRFSSFLFVESNESPYYVNRYSREIVYAIAKRQVEIEIKKE